MTTYAKKKFEIKSFWEAVALQIYIKDNNLGPEEEFSDDTFTEFFQDWCKANNKTPAEQLEQLR